MTIGNDDGSFMAYCSKIPGATGKGRTRAECLANLFRDMAVMSENPEEDTALVPHDAMRFDAAELRMQGDAEGATRALDVALAWYRSCPEPEREPHRAAFARTLYEAEQWDEARLLFEELAAEEPENISHLGHLGTLAARRGDRHEAEQISRALTLTRQRYLFGAHTVWRARIAAQLGDHEGALVLLSQALAQGQPAGVWLLTDPDFAPVRDHRVFRRWVASTG